MRGVKVMLTVLAAAMCGCGGANDPVLPDPVPVSGIVMLRGEPLVSAAVEFIPDEGTVGPGCMAYTDAAGNFQLITRLSSSDEPVDGAIPGRYRVRVSLLTTPDGTPVQMDSETPPADMGAVEKLPMHYSDYAETVLSADVYAGGGPVVLELM
jgi:hypothetical protein